MSLSANVSEKAALIWAIADKLTGVYKPHEYGEVILPLTVIRRFDCILADTKDAVLEKFETVKNLPMRDVLLRNASGKAFYNTSKFTFERLLDDPDNIEVNAQGADKGSALRALAERLGIPREKVMALGDNGNDVTMLQYAGVSVAMGDGSPEAKAAARFLTAPHDQNGLAQAVRQYALS